MTTLQFKILLSAGAAVALASCESGPKAVDPKTVDPKTVDTKTATLKEIVESGVRNPELTDLLNKRLDVLNPTPTRLERELRSGAAEVVMTPDGCGTWVIVGSKRRSLLGRDDTVRARVSLCPNDRARVRSTTVTFGAA